MFGKKAPKNTGLKTRLFRIKYLLPKHLLYFYKEGISESLAQIKLFSALTSFVTVGEKHEEKLIVYVFLLNYYGQKKSQEEDVSTVMQINFITIMFTKA